VWSLLLRFPFAHTGSMWCNITHVQKLRNREPQIRFTWNSSNFAPRSIIVSYDIWMQWKWNGWKISQNIPNFIDRMEGWYIGSYIRYFCMASKIPLLFGFCKLNLEISKSDFKCESLRTRHGVSVLQRNLHVMRWNNPAMKRTWNIQWINFVQSYHPFQTYLHSIYHLENTIIKKRTQIDK